MVYNFVMIRKWRIDYQKRKYRINLIINVENGELIRSWFDFFFFFFFKRSQFEFFYSHFLIIESWTPSNTTSISLPPTTLQETQWLYKHVRAPYYCVSERQNKRNSHISLRVWSNGITLLQKYLITLNYYIVYIFTWLFSALGLVVDWMK